MSCQVKVFCVRMSMHAQYKLFACVGGIHRAQRAGNAGMSKFMNRSPRHVGDVLHEG